MGTREEAAASFEPVRPRLLRVAYRMLGSLADAEDVVQDAFLRWLGADRAAVREPEGYLVRTVTRLCLDALKSARHRRETYVGPWLPEPVLTPDDEIEPDVTLPLLMALERLSPLERAAFLLHDVFGVQFDEVANAIGRDPTTARQLAARAREHVHEDRPRFAVDRQKGLDLASAFFDASQTGDLGRLKSILAADVTFVADGGGKRP
ncbi:MAG: RNA polymerase sigma factor SigJ, partial [Devosia sp.]